MFFIVKQILLVSRKLFYQYEVIFAIQIFRVIAMNAKSLLPLEIPHFDSLVTRGLVDSFDLQGSCCTLVLQEEHRANMSKYKARSATSPPAVSVTMNGSSAASGTLPGLAVSSAIPMTSVAVPPMPPTMAGVPLNAPMMPPMMGGGHGGLLRPPMGIMPPMPPMPMVGPQYGAVPYGRPPFPPGKTLPTIAKHLKLK